MITIEEVHEMLDEIASELPEEVFRDLNGGVSLLADTKRSMSDPNGRLYTLGEYRRDQMGRYIVIYYGSLCALYGNTSKENMRHHLSDVLKHELTHHIESLAGERDLEIKDRIELDDYLNRSLIRNRRMLQRQAERARKIENENQSQNEKTNESESINEIEIEKGIQSTNEIKSESNNEN